MKSTQTELDTWCGALVQRGLVSAAAAGLERAGETLGIEGAGVGDAGPALFDLASLTKPLAATLALVLHQSDELPLGTQLGEIWGRGDDRLRTTRLESLLRHEAGLRRWMPLYAVCAKPAEVADRLLGGEWVERQPSPAAEYSDLDYILWALTLERALGRSFWALLVERVIEPLGAGSAAQAYEAGERAVVCHLTTAVEVDLASRVGLEIDELPAPRRGEPQDGNCRFLGRSLGHAGVFANLELMMQLGREWLHPGALLSEEMVRLALSGDGRYGMGWYRHLETAAGRLLGRCAFGHDGFTGGTLWIDPEADGFAILLCHRTDPGVDLSDSRAELAQWIELL